MIETVQRISRNLKRWQHVDTRLRWPPEPGAPCAASEVAATDVRDN